MTLEKQIVQTILFLRKDNRCCLSQTSIGWFWWENPKPRDKQLSCFSLSFDAETNSYTSSAFFLLFYARISLTTLYIYVYRAVCLRRHNITNKRLTSNTMGDYLDLGMIVFFSIKITYYWILLHKRWYCNFTRTRAMY